MTHKKPHIPQILLALAFIFVACQKDPFRNDTNLYSGTKLISVAPCMDTDWVPVKADYDPVDDAALQESGFGVYAFYTGQNEYSAANVTGLVFNNREFYYDSDTWKYRGKDEYWPTADGDKLTFFAYAPWSTWNSKVSSSDGAVPSIPYKAAASLSETDLQAQRDLLWGTNASGYAHKNVEAADYDTEGTVDMHFRHAVAKVNFTAKGLMSEVNDPVLSDSEDPQTGSYSWDGVPWTDGTSSVTEGVYSYDVTYDEKDDYTTGGWGSRRYYRVFTCTQTETRTLTLPQTQYTTRTDTRSATYTINSKRYLIDTVTFKGFYKSGTLLLDNTSAREPEWTDATAFDGTDPEYVLSAENVLTDSLRKVSTSLIQSDQSDFNKYKGVTTTPTDLMSGYSLFAIPKTVNSTSDQIQVGITYSTLSVEGTLSSTDSRTVNLSRGRTVTKTMTHTRTAQKTVEGSRYWGEVYYETPSYTEFNFSGSTWSDWPDDYTDTQTSNPGSITYDYGDWVSGSMTLTSSALEYGNSTSLSGSVASSLQGGRAYTIGLILAGDKINLDVVPRPWTLEDVEYDYTAESNEKIQMLTCETASVDDVDAQGNVYVGSRVAHFYFCLGLGKYVGWQATLVGDAAFAFTDSDGNFLYQDDGVTRVSSVRGGIDPDVTNHIYVRAIDPSAAVTSKAILRLYYVDSNGKVTPAMDLVDITDINEFTLIQFAN